MLFLTLAAFAQDADDATEPATDGTDAMPAQAEPVEPEAPPEPPKVYTIPPIDDERPNALITRRDVPDDGASIDAFLRETGISLEDFDRPALVHSSWFFRPHTAIAQLIGDDLGGAPAFRFGFSAGRRYATAQAVPVQLLSELGIRFTAPVGGGIGRRLEGFASIGPWLGPVRVQLGLHVRSERERWRRRSLDLQEALLMGGELQVALDLKYVNLDVAVLPMAILAGPRLSARERDPSLPVIASETEYAAGIGIQPGSLGFRVTGSWRDTAIGSLLEVGGSLSIMLRSPK